MASPAPTPNEVRDGPLLKAHSLEFNNVIVLLTVSIVCACAFLGWCIDRMGHKPFKGRPLTWQDLLLLVACYVIWIPAIFASDFSFNIGFIVPVLDYRVSITCDSHLPGNQPGPIHESTRSLIPFMWVTGSPVGAVIFTVYAFAGPTLKLVLLLAGEGLRNSPKEGFVRASRACLLAMKVISKWAAPDMFGYVLIYALIRNLQHLPVDSVCVLDVGFTSYSVFVLTSMWSALHSSPPPLPEDTIARKAPCVLRLFGLRGLAPVTLVFCVLWAALFIVGVVTPSVYLNLDTDGLRSEMPDGSEWILDAVDVNRLVAPQHVSIASATLDLSAWASEDMDLNLVLSVVMLAVFSVAFTVLDMLVLFAAACQLLCAQGAGRQSLRPRGAKSAGCAGRLVSTAQVLRHLSMLDVLSMGVIISVLAGSGYESMGIAIGLLPGIYWLIASEVTHYLVYHLVVESVRFQESEETGSFAAASAAAAVLSSGSLLGTSLVEGGAPDANNVS